MELVDLAPEPLATAEPTHASDSTPTADLAECTCPDFCERDHDND